MSPQIHYITIIAIVLISPLMGLEASETNHTDKVLKIELTKLEVSKSNKCVSWKVVIKNNDSNSIRVSRFSFEALLGTTKLKDENGKVWRVVNSTILEDPPPIEVDYSLVIPGKGSVESDFKTRLLEQVLLGDQKKEQRATPPKLHYDLKGTVGVIDAKTGVSYPMRECVGKGAVEVVWSLK